MEEKINETAAVPKRRKILFVITQSEMGGAQRFVAQLVNGLPRDRFECIVAAGIDGGGSLQKMLPPDVPYITLQSLQREPDIAQDFRSLFELRRLYQEQKPDVIFLNSSKAGFNGSWAASALPGRVSPATVIYRIGGWSFNDPQPGWQRNLSIFLEKFSDTWKDYIIVNNTKDLEDAGLLRIAPRKETLLIHNGIDPYMQFMEPDQAKVKLFEHVFRQQTQEDKGGQAALFQVPYLIGTIANFYPTKGLETLIEAAAKIKSNAAFIIIGNGTLRQQLEKKIKDLGLGNRIYLPGQIPDAAQYLRAFSLFVLPSLKEGFPWSVLEAMAAKVPVVASSTGAIPEIIEQGKNGLAVPPGDSDQLAQAIDTMLSDENLRRQYAIEAHQTLIHRFSLRKMLDEYEKLLS